jgi:glucokinase
MFRAGIDLGGTNIKAGIVDENQKILAEGSVPTRVGRPYGSSCKGFVKKDRCR